MSPSHHHYQLLEDDHHYDAYDSSLARKKPPEESFVNRLRRETEEHDNECRKAKEEKIIAEQRQTLYLTLCAEHDKLISKIKNLKPQEIRAALETIATQLEKGMDWIPIKDASILYQCVLNHPEATLKEKIEIVKLSFQIGYQKFAAFRDAQIELINQINEMHHDLIQSLALLKFAEIHTRVTDFTHMLKTYNVTLADYWPNLAFASILSNQSLEPKERSAAFKLLFTFGYEYFIENLLINEKFMDDKYCDDKTVYEFFRLYCKNTSPLLIEAFTKFWPRLFQISDQSLLFQLLNDLNSATHPSNESKLTVMTDFARGIINSRSS